jgi:site-specific DNA recombinase
MSKKLHIYCRVSSDKQVQGYSLGAQKEKGIQKAKELGYEPIFYEERGASADNDTTLNRPIISKLLKDCEKGLVSDIFVTELDRFTRRIELILEVEKMFVSQKINIHTCSASINLDDPEQRFIALLQSLLGERENKVKSERSKRGMERAAKNGVWIGVMVPYGYKTENKCIVKCEKESEVYIRIVEMCLEGMGTNQIAKTLNKENIFTRGRKVLKRGTHTLNKYDNSKRHIPNEEILWAGGTIYSILTNPIYYGKRRWKTGYIDAPALITEDKWNQAQEALKNRRNYAQKGQHEYLLKGKLKCGRCERNLYGRIKIKDKERYYMCSSKRHESCGLRSPNLDELNDVIWNDIICSREHLKYLLSGEEKDVRKKTLNKEKQLSSLNKNLESIFNMKRRLVELFELGRIELNVYDSRTTEHDKAVENIKLQIEELNSTNIYSNTMQIESNIMVQMDKLKSKMKSLSFIEKRKHILEIIESIEVNYIENKNVFKVKTLFKVGNISYIATSFLTPLSYKNRKKETSIEIL